MSKFLKENAIFFIGTILMVGLFFFITEHRKVASTEGLNTNEVPVVTNTDTTPQEVTTSADTAPSSSVDITPATVTPTPPVKTIPKFVPPSDDDDDEEEFDD